MVASTLYRLLTPSQTHVVAAANQVVAESARRSSRREVPAKLHGILGLGRPLADGRRAGGELILR